MTRRQRKMLRIHLRDCNNGKQSLKLTRKWGVFEDSEKLVYRVRNMTNPSGCMPQPVHRWLSFHPQSEMKGERKTAGDHASCVGKEPLDERHADNTNARRRRMTLC